MPGLYGYYLSVCDIHWPGIDANLGTERLLRETPAAAN
jgi:hypothetical protein